jgi:TonB family protein
MAGRPSRRAIATSLAIHVALLAIALVVPAETLRPYTRPDEVRVAFHRRPRPVEPPRRVVPPPPPPPIAKQEPPRPAPVEPPKPKPIPTPPPRREPPPPEIVRKATPPPKPVPAPKPPPPEPPRVVRTNVFRDDPAPTPAARPAAPAPRTGGFGTAAAQAEPTRSRTRSVASAGFGSAVPASEPEPVAAQPRATVKAGFDAAPATEPAPAKGPTGTASVKRGGFGDTVVVRETLPAREPAAGKPDTPVEIVSKPRPAYTEEARRLKIEGEVVLEVVFVSTGQLRVLGVAQALGHGLDEAAIEAARNIEFKPARRDGKPIDHTARLHIVFQLA